MCFVGIMFLRWITSSFLTKSMRRRVLFKPESNGGRPPHKFAVDRILADLLLLSIGRLKFDARLLCSPAQRVASQDTIVAVHWVCEVGSEGNVLVALVLAARCSLIIHRRIPFLATP
jgi:hypothetical protein